MIVIAVPKAADIFGLSVFASAVGYQQVVHEPVRLDSLVAQFIIVTVFRRVAVALWREHYRRKQIAHHQIGITARKRKN